MQQWDLPGGSVVKNPPAMQETRVQSLDQEDPLGKEMATHSCILAWEIPWTKEPGMLLSMGLQKSQTRLSHRTKTTMQQWSQFDNMYLYNANLSLVKKGHCRHRDIFRKSSVCFQVLLGTILMLGLQLYFKIINVTMVEKKSGQIYQRD